MCRGKREKSQIWSKKNNEDEEKQCKIVVTSRAEILVGIQLDSDWDYLLQLGI